MPEAAGLGQEGDHARRRQGLPARCPRYLAARCQRRGWSAQQAFAMDRLTTWRFNATDAGFGLWGMTSEIFGATRMACSRRRSYASTSSMDLCIVSASASSGPPTIPATRDPMRGAPLVRKRCALPVASGLVPRWNISRRRFCAEPVTTWQSNSIWVEIPGRSLAFQRLRPSRESIPRSRRRYIPPPTGAGGGSPQDSHRSRRCAATRQPSTRRAGRGCGPRGQSRGSTAPDRPRQRPTGPPESPSRRTARNARARPGGSG
jgi:hypothetical protein